MKKLLILLLILPFVATSVSAQLLFKVSGNGLKEPSYIFGTYHFASKNFVDDVPGLRSVLANVDQVCGEVENYSADDELLDEKMMMPEGFSYDQVLDDEHYAKLNKIFIRSFGRGLNHPALADGLGRMRPFVLSEMLLPMLQPVDLSGLDIELDLNHPLDPYFQEYARMHGLSVEWLETTNMQIELLFDRPFEEQLNGLIWWLDNMELSNDRALRLVKAYFKQDLTLITEVFEESIVCYSDEFKRLVVDERNIDWAAKMPPIMADKSTLFFVGVGHLASGDNALLKLLADAGYEVTPVGISQEPEELVEELDVPATFKGGGLSDFRRWVMERLTYPKIAMDNGIQGDVIVEFVIDEKGELTRIKVLQSPDSSLSSEVIAVLKKSPRWKPGEHEGKKVKVKFVLPIRFKVQG